MSKDKIYVAVQEALKRMHGQRFDRDELNEVLFISGMEYAAEYLEHQFYDFSPTIKALRTLADGEEPCEDCGYPLPSHDPSCVSRNLK